VPTKGARVPFENVASATNTAPQVSEGVEKRSLPAMGYRAAPAPVPVLSPPKEHYERRFHASPAKAPIHQPPARQLSEYSGPVDERMRVLHDASGRLNPDAVQVAASSFALVCVRPFAYDEPYGQSRTAMPLCVMKFLSQ
jgi:hypothetical protein